MSTRVNLNGVNELVLPDEITATISHGVVTLNFSDPYTDSYTHTQSTPSTTWTIVHNLGVGFFRLQCTFSDTTTFDGILCDLGDVDEATDANTYVLHLAIPLSGTAVVTRR